MALAQVAKHFPGAPLVSAAWPTRDGWIPWRLLLVLCEQLPHVLALDRLTVAQGTGLGTVMAFVEKNKSGHVLDDTIDQAYPEVDNP